MACRLVLGSLALASCSHIVKTDNRDGRSMAWTGRFADRVSYGGVGTGMRDVGRKRWRLRGGIVVIAFSDGSREVRAGRLPVPA
jgi:hypothetical protein